MMKRSVLCVFGFMGFLAVEAQSPGNVSSNLRLWLKADAGTIGTTPITTWNDQSGNGNNASVPANGPDVLTDQINFNPALDFTSSNNEYLQIITGIFSTGTYNDVWTYVVSRADIDQNNSLLFENLASSEIYSVIAPWSNENIYYDWGTTSTGRLNGAWGTSHGSYNMWTLGTSTGTSTPNGTRKAISSSGSVILSNDNNDNGTGNNSNFYIGGGYNVGTPTTYPFDGQVAEIIIYTGTPSAVQQELIHSYLAIKYGFDKASADNTGTVGEDERDYFASDTTVLWDYSLNSAYSNYVTGIGRDDNSGLDQQKSKNNSVNGGVTMDKGGAFTTDLDYLLWGDDGASSIDNVDVPVGYTDRSNRIWKVQLNGTPGSVTVTIDLDEVGLPNTGSAADYAILIDGVDAVFSAGASAHTTGATLIGSELSFTSVSFSSGDFFAIGINNATVVGPGDVVTGLQLWLKADAGTTGATPLSGWADQSLNNNDVTVATNGPDVLTDQINFNPALDFTSSNNEYVQITNGIFGTAEYDDLWVYLVSKADLDQNNSLLFENMLGSDIFSVLAPWSNENVYYDWGSTSTGRLNGTWGTSHGSYNMWTMGTSTGTSTPNGTRKAISRDGSVFLSNANNDNATGSNANFYIGGGYNVGAPTTYSFDGQLAELVIYTEIPTELEQEKIQTYLAIKYGVSKASADNGGTGGQDERDYFTSDGTVVWDYSDNTTYNNGIIGIGRDDNSILDQKQSLTQDDTTTIYISTLAATNSANGGSFGGDVQFVVVGHNAGDMCATVTSNAEVPATIESKIEREWKITNTAYTSTFSIDWELNTCAGLASITDADLRLLVDADGDFSNAAIYAAGGGLTISNSGGRITVSGISTTHISTNSTAYITLGSVSSGTPLPIELVYFNARLQNESTVLLNWETATEINNDYFTIEKSNDAINWKSIGEIKGAGNSSQSINYSYRDYKLLSGISYYRLKQIDFDGQYTYSQVEVIDLNRPNNFVNIYPNPASKQIVVEGSEEEISTIKIYNVLSKELSDQAVITKENDQRIIINLENFSPGLYYIKTKTVTNKVYKR